MMGLTPTQARCLAIIRERTSPLGASPSYEVIAEALGVKSKSNVHRLVHGLAERGYLRLLPNRRQTVALIEDGLTGDTESMLARLAKRAGKTRDQLVAQAIDEFLLREIRR